MSSPSYLHLFSGSSIDVLALRNALSEENITPVVKDEAESASPHILHLSILKLLIQFLLRHFQALTSILLAKQLSQ